MIFDRTAGDHRFAFRSEVCILCGISRAEFEQAGQPRCTEQALDKPDTDQAPDKTDRFTIAGDDDTQRLGSQASTGFRASPARPTEDRMTGRDRDHRNPPRLIAR